uniref:S1 motif domain-containing protein n=1 Tax=Picocystis salinarum TaxID=88271 RepID=A0A7S3UGD2_9CHLO|mmetsp:Transcript_3832/g.24284  ORF Transcript_3832/g.24284 Transcript_3832/m.24284 type:complete len:145 (+) Transcript_3832:304-738(+)
MKRTQVEGTCSGRYGYIIGVLGKPNVGKGFVVEDHSGQAVFEVKYQAIVFRPFKGEVLDAIVYHVSKMGFFAQAGPLELFVSTHLIPSEYAFSSIDEPCFVSDDSMTRIQQDAMVRLKIIGIQVDPSKIFAVATIKGEYLGVIR